MVRLYSPRNGPNSNPCLIISAQGRDDIRTECAGVIAGSLFAGIGKRGEDLVAAGLLMLAGHVDLAELDKWVRVGWERRRGASEPYPDSEA
jgi:hypothetical protein